MLSDRIKPIKVIYSPWIEKGKILVLGTGYDNYPENWKSMTRDEQIHWAVMHGKAVVINNLEVLDAK